MIFKQGDPAWASKKLGESGLSMKSFGCVVTDVAQSLHDRGHKVDPGHLVDRLNEVGGFTKGGLLIWNKVSEVYPAFKFGTGDVSYVQGAYGRYNHWVLRMDGRTTDPLFGRDRAPKGFKETGRVRKATIDKAPEPEKPVEPTPEEKPKPEAPKEESTYTVVEGDNLTKIAKNHYGITDEGEAYRKALEIAEHNAIPNPDLINPGQVIRLP